MYQIREEKKQGDGVDADHVPTKMEKRQKKKPADDTENYIRSRPTLKKDFMDRCVERTLFVLKLQ